MDHVLMSTNLNDSISITNANNNSVINPMYHATPFMVAPDFNCSATIDPRFISDYYLTTSTLNTYRCQLSFMLQHTKAVVLFYGRDFTTVTNSDLSSISSNMERFKLFGALPLAISIDSEEVHQTYLKHKWEHQQESVPFPLLSDPTRSIVRRFNVLNPTTGAANRAVFIIDRSRQIRFSFVLGDDRILHSMDTIMTMLQMIPPVPA
ncbi:unnamed protein product [Absidia cylindrospora]